MILIYLNTGEWGGVDVFVMRFAEYLRRHNRRFVIVDKDGSRLRRDIPWAKFLTPVEARTTSLPIDRFFFSSIAKMKEDEIPWERFRDVNVFGWIVHHNDTVVQFFPHSFWIIRKFGFAAMRRLFFVFRKYHKKIEDTIKLMARNDAVAVMDKGTAQAVSYFYPGVHENLPIVPVPAPVDGACEVVNPVGNDFTFGYLGRMDDIKFSALGSFIQSNLVELSKERRVRLLAITVGAHVESLKKLCIDSGIELELYGFMPNKEAREVLRNKTHLGIAMGTSALDMAATGHPCVYIDPTERSGVAPQTSFRFVHETDNFTLGQYRDFPKYKGGVRSLIETVRLVERDSSIGLKERRYVEEKHNPDRINAIMLSSIDASTLRMGELEPYVDAIKSNNARDLIWVARLRSIVRFANIKG